MDIFEQNQLRKRLGIDAHTRERMGIEETASAGPWETPTPYQAGLAGMSTLIMRGDIAGLQGLPTMQPVAPPASTLTSTSAKTPASRVPSPSQGKQPEPSRKSVPAPKPTSEETAISPDQRWEATKVLMDDPEVEKELLEQGVTIRASVTSPYSQEDSTYKLAGDTQGLENILNDPAKRFTQGDFDFVLNEDEETYKQTMKMLEEKYPDKIQGINIERGRSPIEEAQRDEELRIAREERKKSYTSYLQDREKREAIRALPEIGFPKNVIITGFGPKEDKLFREDQANKKREYEIERNQIKEIRGGLQKIKDKPGSQKQYDLASYGVAKENEKLQKLDEKEIAEIKQANLQYQKAKNIINNSRDTRLYDQTEKIYKAAKSDSPTYGLREEAKEIASDPDLTFSQRDKMTTTWSNAAYEVERINKGLKTPYKEIDATELETLRRNASWWQKEHEDRLKIEKGKERQKWLAGDYKIGGQTKGDYETIYPDWDPENPKQFPLTIESQIDLNAMKNIGGDPAIKAISTLQNRLSFTKNLQSGTINLASKMMSTGRSPDSEMNLNQYLGEMATLPDKEYQDRMEKLKNTYAHLGKSSQERQKALELLLSPEGQQLARFASVAKLPMKELQYNISNLSKEYGPQRALSVLLRVRSLFFNRKSPHNSFIDSIPKSKDDNPITRNELDGLINYYKNQIP